MCPYLSLFFCNYGSVKSLPKGVICLIVIILWRNFIKYNGIVCQRLKRAAQLFLIGVRY